MVLTAINNIQDTLLEDSKGFKDEKDDIMQFMKAQSLDKELMADTLKFLTYRNGTFSGNMIYEGDPRFSNLSPGLRNRITAEAFLPLLQQVAIFGHSNVPDPELMMIKSFFDRVDTSGDGRLDKGEIRELFLQFDLGVTDTEFDVCFNEMDRQQTGSIGFDDFVAWWFVTKYGAPRLGAVERCPHEFLKEMALALRPRPFPPQERMVPTRSYGNDFIIVISGRVRVLRPGVRLGEKGWHPDHKDRDTSMDLFVVFDDHAPVLGYSACLDEKQFQRVKTRTDYWAVDAEQYCDSLWCSREEFQRLFDQYWIKGKKRFAEVCWYTYQVDSIETSLANDGVDGDLLNNAIEIDDFVSSRDRLASDDTNVDDATRAMVETELVGASPLQK